MASERKKMTTEDILKAIQNGQVNEKWKHSEKKRVLQALAESGYQPDYFIHHKDPDIRRSVLVEHLDYAKYLLNDPANQLFTLCVLWGNPYPPIESLEAALKLDENVLEGFDTDAAQLKLKALKRTPTIIEHTMTRYQLYKNNNPMWTNGLSAVFASAMLYDKYNSEEDFDRKLAFLFEEHRPALKIIDTNIHKW